MTKQELVTELAKFKCTVVEHEARDRYGVDFIKIEVFGAHGRRVTCTYSASMSESDVAHARDQVLEAVILHPG